MRDPDPVRRHTASQEQWLVSAARFLGRAARWARVGADRIIAHQRPRSPVRPKRGRPFRSDGDELRQLAQRLARVVSAHATHGYSTLIDDPTFWELVERLHAQRVVVARAQPPASASAPSASPRDAPQPQTRPSVVEAEAAPAPAPAAQSPAADAPQSDPHEQKRAAEKPAAKSGAADEKDDDSFDPESLLEGDNDAEDGHE